MLILVGGLIGVFMLSSWVDALLQKASGPLPIETRNSIYQAEAASTLLWRLPDLFGIGLIVAGFLRAGGHLGSGVKWGIPAMATGLCIVCVPNIVHAWM